MIKQVRQLQNGSKMCLLMIYHIIIKLTIMHNERFADHNPWFSRSEKTRNDMI